MEFEGQIEFLQGTKMVRLLGEFFLQHFPKGIHYIRLKVFGSANLIIPNHPEHKFVLITDKSFYTNIKNNVLTTIVLSCAGTLNIFMFLKFLDREGSCPSFLGNGRNSWLPII